MNMSLLVASLAGIAIGAAQLAAAGEPPPMPAGAQQAAVWFAVIDGQKTGPMSDDAFNRRLDDGSISDATLVWRDGMADWVRADQTITFKARRVEARLRHPEGPTRRDNAFVAVRYQPGRPVASN